MLHMIQSNRAAVLAAAAFTALAVLGCAREEAPGTSGSESSAADSMAQPPATAGEQGGGMESMPMAGGQDGAAPRATDTHQATGKITRIDRSAGTVQIAHGPVASLEWPAMTMNFRVREPEMLDALEEGRQVQFTFMLEAGGQYVITRITQEGTAESR